MVSAQDQAFDCQERFSIFFFLSFTMIGHVPNSGCSVNFSEWGQYAHTVLGQLLHHSLSWLIQERGRGRSCSEDEFCFEQVKLFMYKGLVESQFFNRSGTNCKCNGIHPFFSSFRDIRLNQGYQKGSDLKSM